MGIEVGIEVGMQVGMEGAASDRFPVDSPSRLSRLLARLERRYYAAIGPPDLLLILRVEPELALRRRPEDPECRVRRRAEEILRVDWSKTPAHVLDAPCFGGALSRAASGHPSNASLIRTSIWRCNKGREIQ